MNTLENDPLVSAENEIDAARAATTTDARHEHVRQARAWLERTRHELVGLQRDTPANAGPQLRALMEDIASRLYRGEQIVTGMEGDSPRRIRHV